MNKISNRRSTLVLAAAFALPPKIIEYPIDVFHRTESQALKEFPVPNLAKWHSEPNIHGGSRIHQNSLESLSKDGKSTIRYSLADLHSKRESPKTGPLAEYFPFTIFGDRRIPSPNSRLRILENGDFFLEMVSGPVETLWKMNLGMEVGGLASTQSKNSRPNFTAWSKQSTHLVSFDWGLREDGGQAKIVRIQWITDGEVLLFDKCSEGLFVVIEQQPNGTVLFYYLRSQRPENFEYIGFSKIDVSGQMRSEEVSAIRHDRCQTFYLLGSFGLIQAPGAF